MCRMEDRGSSRGLEKKQNDTEKRRIDSESEGLKEKQLREHHWDIVK